MSLANLDGQNPWRHGGANGPLHLDEFGNTKLHTAVSTNSYRDLVKLIASAENSDHLNLQNANGFTALHTAVRCKRYKMIRTLLICRVDDFIFDKEGLSPFHLACREGSVHCLRMLTARVERRELEEAKSAIGTRRVGRWASAGMRWPNDSPTESGEYGIHLAAREGNLDNLKYLIREGHDLNLPTDSRGFTALHIAIEADRPAVFEFLLEQLCIDLDFETDKGITPYQFAAFLQRDYFVQRLYEEGANLHSAPPGMTREQILGYNQDNSDDSDDSEDEEAGDSDDSGMGEVD